MMENGLQTDKVTFNGVTLTQAQWDGLFDQLEKLGMFPNEVHSYNVGSSNYHSHFIQPWMIWQDYVELTSWDHDIIKRVCRTKVEPGMSWADARIQDYGKIKHICDERIRQLNWTKKQ